VRDHIIPKRIAIEPFNYAEQNHYLKTFDWMTLKKKGVEGVPTALHFSGRFKEATGTFDFSSNEPSPNFL